MSVSSKADLLRAQLNLKNLRRHDADIEEIIGSTPYVTVYYNTGLEWTKTNIEGPMFLFSRSSLPRYGFFVLNRQGLEYVQEFLTPESDVKVNGEFILYEPHGEADRATGIWIAEEKDRVELCRRMEELRVSSKPVAPPTTSLPYNQSIPLDMLFASSAPKPSPPKVPTSAHHPNLDMLFASTSSPPQPTAPATPGPMPAAPPAGMSLLDSIFKSARATPPPPTPPAPVTAPPKPNDAAALLAMIGLGSPLSQAQALPTLPLPLPQQPRAAPAPVPAPARAAPIPAPQPSAPTTSTSSSAGPKPSFAPPLLSHDIFASLPLPGKKQAAAAVSPVIQPRSPPGPAAVPAPVVVVGVKPTTEEAMARAVLEEKARIAKSISGPSSALAPSAVEGKLPAMATGRSNGHAPVGLSNGVEPSPVRKGASPVTVLKKAVVLELVDELAGTAMDGAGAEQGGAVLSQRDFVQSVGELLQRPAFATALYARYLERCEED